MERHEFPARQTACHRGVEEILATTWESSKLGRYSAARSASRLRVVAVRSQGKSSGILFSAMRSCQSEQGNHSESPWPNQNLSERPPRLPLAWYLLSVREPHCLSSFPELNSKRTGSSD